MSKGRRVGGSGWAGVHGSFVGLGGRGKAAMPQSKGGNYGPGGLPVSLEDARKAGLSVKRWRAQADKTVNRIERKLIDLRSQVKELEKQLLTAEKSRQAAYRADDVGRKRVAPTTAKLLP